MSETSRSRLYEIGQKRLELEMEEWTFIAQHIGDFCLLSDQKVKQKFGMEANEDVCVGKEKMSDDEFIGFVTPIIQELLERFGFRRRKKRTRISEVDEDENYNQWLLQEGHKMHEKAVQEQKLCSDIPERHA